MLHVLTFTTLYPNSEQPRHGIFVEERMRHFVSAGHGRVEVIAPVPWFPFPGRHFGEYARYARVPDEETRYGVRVFHPRFPVIPKVGMTIGPALQASFLYSFLKKHCNRNTPFDLIDAHYLYPDGVAAVFLARRLGIPVVITARGSDINLLSKFALPRRMIQWAAENADRVITVSRALKNQMIELGIEESKICAIRNGVDLERFFPDDRRRLRREKGLSGFVLLSVGNLIKSKGHDLAIRSLQKIPEARLQIVGDGPERGALEHIARELQVADRVRFAGTLPHEYLREYFSSADALVLASEREGMPNVVLESLACGTPVIASRVGGIPEIMQEPEMGVLLRARTVESLVGAVRDLMQKPRDRDAIRQYASQFSWDDTVHELRDVMDQVANR